MIPLPLWVYAGIGCVLAVGFGALQTHRLHATQKEYAAFVATVKAQGEEAERQAKSKAEADRKAKENTDAQHAKLAAANAALSRSLLDARSRGGYLPTPASGSASPGRACFDRAELESAIRQLDAGVSGLLSEGDQARVGLDSAKDWTKALK